MTASEEALIVGRAARPDYNDYYIFYSTPCQLGWSVVVRKSPNSVMLVRDEFLNDFFDENPKVLFIACPGAN